MPVRGCVHLLFEHPLVRRADRVLRPAEHLCACQFGLAERELGDRAADAPLYALRAIRDFVVALALAPLPRAVRIADRHPDDRDRRVHAAERDDARNAAAGPHDHAPADLLPENPVRRADVVAALGRDRRSLQAQAVLSNCSCRVVHDRVVGGPARFEGEVEASVSESLGG